MTDVWDIKKNIEDNYRSIENHTTKLSALEKDSIKMKKDINKNNVRNQSSKAENI